jgi:dCMP deaminase
MIQRTPTHLYYLNIASVVAKRSSCIRSMYGAVIVKDDVIKSTGYNGSCRGAVNCCDTGVCRREGVKSRTGFEDCPAIHAEENAIIFSSPQDRKGSTIYISAFGVKTGEFIEKSGSECYPCYRCLRKLTNGGIEYICVKGNDGYPEIHHISNLQKIDPLSFKP